MQANGTMSPSKGLKSSWQQARAPCSICHHCSGDHELPFHWSVPINERRAEWRGSRSAHAG